VAENVVLFLLKTEVNVFLDSPSYLKNYFGGLIPNTSLVTALIVTFQTCEIIIINERYLNE